MPIEHTPAFREHAIEWTDEKVSRLWDHYARTPPYCDIYFSKLFGGSIIKKSGLPLQQDLKVLDFGCGPGFIWAHLQALGAQWEYTGLDFSPDSVKKVTQQAKGHPRFAGAQHVTQLPTTLPDAQFDVVLLFEVVEHLKDEHLDATLSEVSRVLKQGGVLVITTPNEEDLNAATKFCPDCGAVFHEWQHVRNWNVDSLAAWIRQHGFSMRKAHTLDFTAQGLLKWVVRLGRKLLGRKVNPHMIAIFQKH